MNQLNPDKYLLKIQKQKYKFAFLPILLVIICFFLQINFRLPYLKYISIAGLLIYFIVVMIFRVNKAVSPETNELCLLSPINGKILLLEDKSLILKKSFFDPVDLRCSSKDNLSRISWKKASIKLFENNCKQLGKLIGFVWGSAICEFFIPDNFHFVVKAGEKVIAGETIIALVDSQSNLKSGNRESLQ